MEDQIILTMYNCEDEEMTIVAYNPDSVYKIEIIQDGHRIYINCDEAKELYRFLGEVLNEKSD